MVISFRSLCAAGIVLLAGPLRAQMVTNTTMTPAQLVQNVLLGGGVTVSNIKYNGVPSPPTAQPGSGSFTATPGSFDLAQGLILSSGQVSNIPGPEPGINSDPLGTGSDPDLLSIIAQLNPNNPASNDRAVLEFDFIPTGDSVKFNYVFASEEYPGFNCSPQFNDVFGFFISGPGITGPFTNNAMNIALVPGTTLPVSISNIHGADGGPGCAAANAQYYISNTGGTTVIFGGYTTVLTAKAAVVCGQTYHIKLAICDAGDTAYDSAVFLEAGSFASTGQIVPSLTTGAGTIGANDSTMFEGCGVIPFNFFRMGDTTNTDTVNLVIGGTATPGVDYYPPLPTQIIYQPGDTMVTFPLTVPYDADGIETITIHITQNIVCSGSVVISDYTFYIDQYPPLQVVTNDVNGACGQSYDIGPQVSAGAGQYHYLWSTGETTPTIHVQVDTTTTFLVTVTDTCSVAPVQDSITVFIPVYAPMAVTASPDTAIPCLGNGNITVLATSGGNGVYTYQWTHNGTNAGAGTTLNVPASDTTWYMVTARDGCLHSATDSVRVSTVPLPGIQIQNWDSLVFCTGDSLVLFPRGVTGGNGVYSYAWTGASGTVLSTADTLLVGVPADAFYSLNVQDQCGYSADSLFRLRIPHYAPFAIRLTPDSTICAGDSIDLRAQVTGGSGVYTLDWEGWAWSDPVYRYTGDQDALFKVDVLDHCGAFISARTQVTVQHPEAHILIYNQGQDDWLFQAATVPYFVPVMIWDLGDGTIVKSTSITHSYMDVEDHWVHLHTVSTEGCKAQDSLLIKPPGTLFFPNAFTPDGDGVNDQFFAIGSSVDQFQMTIFDRWGHVVFESNDIHTPWDGKVNGGPDATTGVYVYKYRAKGHYFEAHEKYGHVTLVRGTNGR